MERANRIAVVASCAAAFIAGCGGDDDYENRPRPPEPIVVSASINDGDLSVSPQEFGAGPITLIATNQTDKAKVLRLETSEIGGTEAGIQQETGPINPGDTASLKANLREGTYSVSVADEAVTLDVGEPRESAQNELLQP